MGVISLHGIAANMALARVGVTHVAGLSVPLEPVLAAKYVTHLPYPTHPRWGIRDCQTPLLD